MAFDELEPPEDPYWIMGRICASTVNLWRGRGERPFTPEDFIPWLNKPSAQQSQDEIEAQNMAIMQGLMASQNAKAQ